jgi:hypothetical protein
MLRPKFDYNDVVCVRPGVTTWFDITNRTSSPRIGERASVFSVTTDRETFNRPQFPRRVIYGIEFEDGDSIEVHENDLELIEANR